jgi:hypothetical protein
MLLPVELSRNENVSAAPWFSPGLVTSEEVILRTVLDPDHLQSNGKLADAAISLEDIRVRGWSVDRKKFTSPWTISLFHSRWKSRKPAINNFYVLPILVRDLRIQDDKTGIQEFVVVDAALCFRPSHAAVLFRRPQAPSAARKFRTDLIQRLPRYVDVSLAFDSDDRYGFTRGMIRHLVALFSMSFRYLLGFKN